MADLEGPLSNPAPALDELARILSAQPSWEIVKAALRNAWNATGDRESVMEAGFNALREVGLGGDELLRNVPKPYAELMSAEQKAQAAKAVEYYMVASAANDIVHGEPLPIMAIAGGRVSVEVHELEGLKVPVVQAYVTALGDPIDIAERFLATCYRTFESDTFARHERGTRDGVWWSRHKRGEPYRQIALSDESSGLPPEARANPGEYRLEVVRATDTVRRAVRRFDRRWTQKLDSLSKKPD